MPTCSATTTAMATRTGEPESGRATALIAQLAVTPPAPTLLAPCFCQVSVDKRVRPSARGWRAAYRAAAEYGGGGQRHLQWLQRNVLRGRSGLRLLLGFGRQCLRSVRPLQERRAAPPPPSPCPLAVSPARPLPTRVRPRALVAMSFGVHARPQTWRRRSRGSTLATGTRST